MNILYEDGHILIAEKPVGVLSQASPGASSPDMVTALRTYLATEENPAPYVAAVHRLDQAVGGVMVYAKKPYAARVLSECFAEHGTVIKEYLCVVWGRPPKETDTLCDLLIKDAKQNKVFVTDRTRGGVRKAQLSYRCLAEKETEDGPVSLLSVTLGTGRSHQIRAQLSHMGNPILSDGKYGGKRLTNDTSEGIALRAWHLALPHPANTERSRDGRKPNPKAPHFPDPDVFCPPSTDTLPFSLFRDEIQALPKEKDIPTA